MRREFDLGRLVVGTPVPLEMHLEDVIHGSDGNLTQGWYSFFISIYSLWGGSL
jgi:hypothetical protein